MRLRLIHPTVGAAPSPRSTPVPQSIGPGAGLLQPMPLWERRPRRDQPRCHNPSARGGPPTTNAPVGAAPSPRSTPVPQSIGPRAGLLQPMPLWERRPRRDQPRCHNPSARGRASYNRHPHRRPDKPAAGPVHSAGLVDAPAAYPPYCGSGALAAINPGATIHRPGGGPPTTAIPTAGRINRPPGRCIRRVWWMRLPAFPPDNASTLRLRR